MNHQSAEENAENSSPLISMTVHPGTEPVELATVASMTHSVVLITNALGSLPTRLHTTVRAITDSGKPIFILPDNSGENHGVIRIVDKLQIQTLASGAIFLEKGNINNERDVYAAIAAAVAKGLRGAELGETIRQQFAYGHDEEKPTSILDQPEVLQRALSERFGKI